MAYGSKSGLKELWCNSFVDVMPGNGNFPPSTTESLMKSLPHIEKSGFRKGEYVAYINGTQRVRRSGVGWSTYVLGSSSGEFTPISAPTLEAMDAKIAEMRKSPYVPTLSR